VITINKIDKPNKIYAEVIEDGAMDQFIEAMNQPSTIRGALMPDAHQGYTLPIGAVIETNGMVFPSYVGFDIGCGMCAVPLTIPGMDISIDPDEVWVKSQKIYELIKCFIPVGYNKHSLAVREMHKIDRNPDNLTQQMSDIFIDKLGYLQLGTLGGGNHFIEIGVDNESRVWAIVHSGSRGVGHGCASYYMRLAHPNNKAGEGHYGFSTDSQNGKDYIKDLNFCLDYALLNRKVMIRLIIDAINEAGIECSYNYEFLINRNHNHAESKDGVKWIHRKGATHAEMGMMGVIPGNMRDGSFIVRGLGNEDSLCSSSHGAGRVLGRRKAKETLDIDAFEDTMKGIVANISKSTLDESPMAYKDIFEVMRLQAGLVEVITHVKPLINVKG
jgi:tRNA-splicing ligase RtcB